MSEDRKKLFSEGKFSVNVVNGRLLGDPNVIKEGSAASEGEKATGAMVSCFVGVTRNKWNSTLQEVEQVLDTHNLLVMGRFGNYVKNFKKGDRIDYLNGMLTVDTYFSKKDNVEKKQVNVVLDANKGAFVFCSGNGGKKAFVKANGDSDYSGGNVAVESDDDIPF